MQEIKNKKQKKLTAIGYQQRAYSYRLSTKN